MSCITKLLEMKGDKEFLPVDKYTVIEGGGVYKDYEYLITFVMMGFRCGYIALKDNDSDRYENMNDLNSYDIDIECHGGITFIGAHHGSKDLLQLTCSDKWIGFDCGHARDRIDNESLIKYFNEEIDWSRKGIQDRSDLLMGPGYLTVRTYKYVENECKSIIEQLLGKKWLEEHTRKH